MGCGVAVCCSETGFRACSVPGISTVRQRTWFAMKLLSSEIQCKFVPGDVQAITEVTESWAQQKTPNPHFLHRRMHHICKPCSVHSESCVQISKRTLCRCPWPPAVCSISFACMYTVSTADVVSGTCTGLLMWDMKELIFWTHHCFHRYPQILQNTATSSSCRIREQQNLSWSILLEEMHLFGVALHETTTRTAALCPGLFFWMPLGCPSYLPHRQSMSAPFPQPGEHRLHPNLQNKQQRNLFAWELGGIAW